MAEDTERAHARSRILDAAEALFARNGFDGTSTARLAHAADVPKGLLFYYFRTKQDILTALLAERLSTALDPGTLIVPGDPVQTLINVADRVLGDRAASAVLREVVWHEAHIRPEVREVLTRYRHALHDAIERALRASLPGPVDVHALRAAAAAWSATITARPLEPASSDRSRLHEAASLRAIARLLSVGLLSATMAS
jgi:AcrR family transcriptional regulator